MRMLTEAQLGEWALEAGFRPDGAWKNRGLDPSRQPESIRIRLPSEATAVAALAYMIGITGVPGFEEPRFPGAMLWLRRWEIWSESIDRTGYALLEGLRRGAEHGVSIEAAPGLSFGQGEFFPPAQH